MTTLWAAPEESPRAPGGHVARIAAALAPLGLACGRPRLLAQGANNRVYAFEAGGRALVAKIGVNPASRRLHLEWELLRAHPALGAACLAFTVEADGGELLVQEHLAGGHPITLDGDALEALGRLMRGYHGLAAPVGAPEEDWMVFAERRILEAPPEGPQAALAEALAELRGAALQWGRRMEALEPGGTRVLVHGDLIALNLIRQGAGRFRIIDWEGLRLDEPEADVVTLWKAFRCGETGKQAFLRGYGPGLRPLRLRFRRFLHDLQVASWRLACQLPGAQGAALEKGLQEAREELASAREALEAAGGR